MSDFEHVTTQAAVDVYESSTPMFDGILREVRELSRKKPEATMSAGKVKIVNRVLNDLLTILKDEPEGKYLEVLDDDSLPQVSDAVLAMVQFETALASFYARYNKYVYHDRCWITEEFVSSLDEEEDEDEDED
jgi:hypothetical protein